jgi:hypothetical protein
MCLRRGEEWTFRAAEGCLAEHHDLWAALGLTCVPDDTTLDRVLRRLGDAVVAQALTAARRQLPSPQESPLGQPNHALRGKSRHFTSSDDDPGNCDKG